MRNLKKILALALALVMTLSVMSVASASTAGTSFKDDASITQYDEAVQVLTGLGVLKGGDNNSFNPNDTITRAEAAAIIYRVVTGDVDDEKVALWAVYADEQFNDVNASDWYAGYVGYCANAQYIKGYDNGQFGPKDSITGNQVLAIMLRALGYDKEGEYTGANWARNAYDKAYELGIVANVSGVAMSNAQTRATVAELVFRAMLCSTVAYNTQTKYSANNLTLGWTVFGLWGNKTGATNEVSGSAVIGSDVVFAAQSERTKAGREFKVEHYGAPVAHWYYVEGHNIPGVASTSTKTVKTIDIFFDPVYSTHEVTTYGELYAKAGLRTTTMATTYSVDGVSDTQPTLASGSTTALAASGKGTLTELFVVDGRVFVTVKHTFVNVVKTAYDKDTGIIVVGTNTEVKDGVAEAARTLKSDTVILYNKYASTIDGSTIHAAEYVTANVDYTYDHTVADSTITVGTKVYNYNSNVGHDKVSALSADSTYGILNRDDSELKVTNYKVNLYFDDYGNVIYSGEVAAPVYETGYVLVRSGEYGGNVADNRWVAKFNVILTDGTQTTITGAISTKAAANAGYYETQQDASDATAAALGLYSYQIIDGYYRLYRVDDTTSSHKVSGLTDDTTGVSSSVSRILAGQADALGASNAILNDNTVFFITNYNDDGSISGYTRVVGYKNIPDLTGGSIEPTSIVITNRLLVEYVVDSNKAASIVFVRNATKSTDIANPTNNSPVFVMLDKIPNQYTTPLLHDDHIVATNGQVKALGFQKDVGAGLTNGYVYTYNPNEYGYVTGPTQLTTGTITYKAPGVVTLAANTYCSNRTISALTYLAVADDCVVYTVNVSAQTIKTGTITDISSSGSTGIVSAVNAYGFATEIYIIVT
jgi:hypothetical protein